MERVIRVLVWLIGAPVAVFVTLWISGELWERPWGKAIIAALVVAWILLLLVSVLRSRK